MIDQEKKTIHRRILLLGGTGAMGEHLTRILAEQGDDVHVTTRSCRMSERNITYVQGNAHEITFINDLLRESWDAIVDFMVYNTDEFRVRVSQLLKLQNNIYSLVVPVFMVQQIRLMSLLMKKRHVC